jgi:hypothetical protein
MSSCRFLLHGVLAILAVLAPSSVPAAVIKEIQAASTEASQAPHGDAVSTARLEAALKQGEAITASLQSEVVSLQTERAKLVQVQTALTSGLIGAIVTAIVAIGSALMGSRNSRPDRDLKRLAVLEKARELQQAGIRLPEDIAKAYASPHAEGYPPP